MKTKDQIATKQERILQEKERELAALQKEKGDLVNQLEKSNDTHTKLFEQHNEAKELLKKNEALINYLNHKLTELQNVQPQQGRLLNGNMTLDSSSSTNHQFRPSSFLSNSQTNGEPHSMRHVAQFPSLQTHYEPMNKSQVQKRKIILII
jgi:chromosome segregation ATPase